jgi:hypothetical protein
MAEQRIIPRRLRIRICLGYAVQLASGASFIAFGISKLLSGIFLEGFVFVFLCIFPLCGMWLWSWIHKRALESRPLDD